MFCLQNKEISSSSSSERALAKWVFLRRHLQLELVLPHNLFTSHKACVPAWCMENCLFSLVKRAHFSGLSKSMWAVNVAGHL